MIIQEEQVFTIKIELNICVWEDNGLFFCHHPRHAIVGYGESKEDALEHFDKLFKDYIDKKP